MWKWNSSIICLLSASLLTGCGQPYPPEVDPAANGGGREVLAPSVPAPEVQTNTETVVIPEDRGDLTLGQALSLTVMHNSELKTFSLETRAAEARVLQAGLRPNPELEIEVENVGGTGSQRGFDAAESTLQLSQLIELGDKAGKRQKVAAFEKELADLDFQSKKLDLFGQAGKAFISVLKAQEELQLSHELLKLSEDSFAAVEKKVSSGKDSPVEKTQASVALSQMKIAHLETQRNLDYARKYLSSFWGQETPRFEQAVGNLSEIEPLSPPEEWVPRLKQNPLYTRWDTEIKKSRAVMNLEKSRAMGDITVGAGVRRFNETDDNAFVLGVSIPLPLSDRNQGARQESVYYLAKSIEEQKAAGLKLNNAFNQTYQDCSNACHRAISLKNDVLPGAHEMLDAVTRAYQEGKVGYLNLLDAQRTYCEVKREYIQALAAYHAAKIEMDCLIRSSAETVTLLESEK